MSIDVQLYRFEGVDTDAILKLWQYSEEPWAHEAFENWKASPQSERGNYPSAKDRADSCEKLAGKARELGLPEQIVEASVFGGKQISFPSTRQPAWPVGEWYSFSTVRELMEYFTGKNFYFVLPEAEGIHGLFRPNWAAARKRLAGILDELKNLTRDLIDDFHQRFVMAHISPVFLEKLKSLPMATSAEIFMKAVWHKLR